MVLVEVFQDIGLPGDPMRSQTQDPIDLLRVEELPLIRVAPQGCEHWLIVLTQQLIHPIANA